jgi:hypothetical protein
MFTDVFLIAFHQSRNMETNNVDVSFVVPAVNWPSVSLKETFPTTTQLVTSKAANITALRSCKVLPANLDLRSVDSKQRKSYRL